MKKRDIAFVAIFLLIIVVPSGFAYAYFNKPYVVNQTKSELESLGYQVTDNTTGWGFSQMNITVVRSLTTFISDVKNVEAMSGSPEPIYQQGDNFYIILPVLEFAGYAIEYTPNTSVWWIW